MSFTGGGSGQGPIESAFIEITANTDAAERNIEAVEGDLKDLDRFANLISENISQHFRETGEILSRSFEQAKDASTRDLNAINQRMAASFQNGVRSASASMSTLPGEFERVRRASTANLVAINRNIASAFQTGAAAANESLDSIGGADEFAPVVTNATLAAQAVARLFGLASAQADESLDNIGGADTFAGTVLGAQLAARQVGNAFQNAGFRARVSIGGVTLGVTSLGAAISVLSGAMVAFATIATAQIEQVEVAFNGLLGSEELAGALLDELFQLAATTPFEIQGLAENTAKLLASADAMGISRDAILDTLTVIGDLAVALGQPIEAVDSVTRALGQMAARGQVMTEELLQISEALPGFAVFDALAEGLGTTTEELDEMLRKGLVPSKEAISIILEEMRKFPGAAGAMGRASQTLTGLFSTLKDEVRFALIDAFEPFTNNLRTIMGEAADILEPAITEIARPLNELATIALRGVVFAIQELSPALGNLFEGMVQVSDILQPVLQRVLAAGAGLLGSLGPALDATARALEPILTLLAELAEEQIPQLITVFADTVTALTPTIALLSELAGVILPLLVSVLDTIPAPVLAALVVMVEFNKTVGLIGRSLPNLVTGIKGFAASLSPASVALGALVIGLGFYAQAQAEARAEQRAIDQQVQQFSHTLSDAENAVAGVRDAIEELVQSGEEIQSTLNLAQLDTTDALTALGLSAQDAARLIEEGQDAIAGFVAEADTSNKTTEVAAANLTALSDNMQAASQSTIDAKVALEDFTEEEANAAIEANTASDGTINYVAALNELLVASQESAAQAERHAQAEQARKEAMEATEVASHALQEEINAILDGTGNVSRELANFALAADQAELSDEQLAAAADLLGVSITDVATAMSVTVLAVESFQEAIEGSFPSIADSISSLDEITFDNLLETFRKTFEAAVQFEENLALLAEFPNVQRAAAAAGPEVAAALAQGFRDGNTAGLAEMELLAQGTQTSFDRTIAAGQEWGLDFAATTLQGGVAGSTAFNQGLTIEQTAAAKAEQARINIRNAKEGIQSAASTIGTGATTGFSTGSSGMGAAAAANTGSAVATVTSYSTAAYDAGYGVGQSVGSGVSAGISSYEYDVRDKAQQLVLAAETAARNAARSQSPSKLFAELGQDLVAGLSQGMVENEEQVRRDAERLINTAAGVDVPGGFNTGTTEQINLVINVTATPGVTDAEASRFGGKVGDTVIAALNRRRVRTEARIT